MKKLIQYSVLFILLLSLFASCRNEKKGEHSGHDQQQEQDVYTCPMHPEIIRNAPGSCPICGMDLVKKETGNKSILDIELEALLKPVNEFVVSAIPVITIEQREKDLELTVVGTVAYDTRQTGVISSRVKGRIEKLYIRYRYQPLRKGQRVMEIYSPDLVTAQQNLIFLLQNDPNNSSLINAAKDRLILMGMTSNQVAEVANSKNPKYSVAVFSSYSGFVTDFTNSGENFKANGMQSGTTTSQELSVKEGMYVQSGQSVFSVYNPARALILLDIFPEQQTLVKTGNAVRIVPETAPHQSFRAKIDYIEPIFRPGSKTLSARVYFNNSAMQLPIGSRVTANIFPPSKNAFWLPKEAVITLGRNKIVFRKEPGGFRTYEITTGIELNNLIQVISGLTRMDSVAANAHFLIDNEAFIKVKRQ
jgi:membrane fusion protein, copper/silver efflux system